MKDFSQCNSDAPSDAAFGLAIRSDDIYKVAVADGLLQAAQDAKGRIVDHEILADLLAQLSQLLGGGGDNSNDGNGNLPLAPAPQPTDDGGSEVVVELEQVVSSAVDTQPVDQETVATAVEAQQEQPTALDKLKAKLNRAYPWPTPQPQTEQGASAVVAIATQPEPLIGQSCEWASPWASPLVSPLATPLCCQMEDCPQSVLAGQSVEIACVVSDAPKKPEYIELVPVSREVHYQRRTHDGEIICCYVGFNNKTKAKQWGEFLAVHHSVAAGFQLRASELGTAFKWEIKLWGMSLKQIEKLAESDLQKSPPSNFGTAPKRKPEPVAPVPKPLQIEDIEVGDIVRNTTVKNWRC